MIYITERYDSQPDWTTYDKLETFFAPIRPIGHPQALLYRYEGVPPHHWQG